MKVQVLLLQGFAYLVLLVSRLLRIMGSLQYYMFNLLLTTKRVVCFTKVDYLKNEWLINQHFESFYSKLRRTHICSITDQEA